MKPDETNSKMIYENELTETVRNSSDQIDVSNRIELLCEMFPMIDTTTVADILVVNNWDVDQSFEALLALNSTVDSLKDEKVRELPLESNELISVDTLNNEEKLLTDSLAEPLNSSQEILKETKNARRGRLLNLGNGFLKIPRIKV